MQVIRGGFYLYIASNRNPIGTNALIPAKCTNYFSVTSVVYQPNTIWSVVVFIDGKGKVCGQIVAAYGPQSVTEYSYKFMYMFDVSDEMDTEYTVLLLYNRRFKLVVSWLTLRKHKNFTVL